jgi:hypothetical protein
MDSILWPNTTHKPELPLDWYTVLEGTVQVNIYIYTHIKLDNYNVGPALNVLDQRSVSIDQGWLRRESTQYAAT